MGAERLLLSEKYKAFLRCDAPVEFLEGTTAAGKTTVGLFKFMLKVAERTSMFILVSLITSSRGPLACMAVAVLDRQTLLTLNGGVIC